MSVPYATDADQEPEYRCSHCPRLLRNDELHRQVCFVCQDRALKHLRAFPTYDKKHPGLYDQLATVMTHRNTSNGDKVSGSPVLALPGGEEALDLRGPGGIVSTLIGIECRWLTANNFTLPGFRGNYEQELPDSVKALANNLPWACEEYPEVAQDLRKIAILHARASNAITGDRHVTVPLGYCPTTTPDGVPCGEPLKASPFGSDVHCQGCGVRWRGFGGWLQLGAEMRGLPSAIAAAA